MHYRDLLWEGLLGVDPDLDLGLDKFPNPIFDPFI